MKVLRGFVLCLYCLMLAITGVSFLMGSTCKTAISDIVVYKSEDKITDAIASVDPNLAKQVLTVKMYAGSIAFTNSLK